MFAKNRNSPQRTWKEKAKKRRIEIKSLKKRIIEIIQSRENWKKVAEEYRELNVQLKEELKKKKLLRNKI